MIEPAIGSLTVDNAPIQKLPHTDAEKPVALAKFNKSKSKLLFYDMINTLGDKSRDCDPRPYNCYKQSTRSFEQLAFGTLISSVDNITSNQNLVGKLVS